MAFPGGRKDPADADLLSTAVRETAEEVGLRLDAATQLVGRLDDLPAIARGRPVGLVIAPFVFAVEGEVPLRPNPREVEEALWAPLTPIFRGERNVAHPYEWEGRQVSLPGYDVDGRTVWGLTHRMLQSLFETLMMNTGEGAHP
jgi:8-oxo-dGTP pyrophosphatase MutT (NUDIX family)